MASAPPATSPAAHGSDLDRLAINTIRTLSMDAVEAAKSGHPGTPMALAPVAFTVWRDFLRYDPLNPHWPNRDRFVLSCGHASMLLYSLIHLAGIRRGDAGDSRHNQPAISLDNIQNFRQLGSVCAGHPEHHMTAGIETTTGPLGQGCGNSVGMAIASRWLAAHYNQPGQKVFDYDTYVLCSDGDLMEGISSEAASIAGHLRLSNLCWIYDDNSITIEGETELAFSEDVGLRFKGLGWHIERVADANDTAALKKSLTAFKAEQEKPTLIIVKSVIGYGAPKKAGSHEAHGAPLGPDDLAGAKKSYGWDPALSFLVPPEVPQHFARTLGARGAEAQAAWLKTIAAYAESHQVLSAELKDFLVGRLPADWEKSLPTFPADPKGLASRVSSGKVLQALSASVPWFLGGSADLSPSTMTHVPGAGDFEPDSPGGRNFHFGIREHGMAAACNGMALSGLRPYCATFFVFLDYLKPSLRLSAIGNQGVIYILTHDSIGLGEDGPTHQPIEQLASVRAVPGLSVFRPSDANEVTESYRVIIKRLDRPAVLVLSRQNLPTLDRTQAASAAGVARGAYVLVDAPGGKPDCILIGTGSEVQLCLDAKAALAATGIHARVVSMPCWDLFEEQDAAYRESVLPASITARVACEAAGGFGWERWIGSRGRFIGMKSFGASAPAPLLYKHFGITADAIAAAATQILKKE
ncbi:MAG: transketolase [Planctomycetota bacterium]|nr:MAG: transketolase [Planctomycetota bacterium]